MRSDATPSEAMKLEFTKHAAHVMAERAVSVEWIERAVAKPALREPDPNDPEVERFFCPVPERDRPSAACSCQHPRFALAGSKRIL